MLVSLTILAALPAYAADFKDGTVALTFQSKAITKAVTEGGNSRGPALALLKDHTAVGVGR